MNKFHFTYLFCIICILCTVNCIAKSVCTIVPIAYSASNVKQRMLRTRPLYTLYTQPVSGGRPRCIGWLPLYPLYTQPMAGWHQQAMRGYCYLSDKGQRGAGWVSVLGIKEQPMVGWVSPFIHKNLPDDDNVDYHTGAVPP